MKHYEKVRGRWTIDDYSLCNHDLLQILLCATSRGDDRCQRVITKGEKCKVKKMKESTISLGNKPREQNDAVRLGVSMNV